MEDAETIGLIDKLFPEANTKKACLNAPVETNDWEKDNPFLDETFCKTMACAYVPEKKEEEQAKPEESLPEMSAMRSKYADLHREIAEYVNQVREGIPTCRDEQPTYASVLSNLKARATEIQTEAKEYYLARLDELVSLGALDRYAKFKLKTTQDLQRMADMKEEILLETAIDRLNSTINAQLRAISSLLFQAGQEARAARYGPT